LRRILLTATAAATAAAAGARTSPPLLLLAMAMTGRAWGEAGGDAELLGLLVLLMRGLPPVLLPPLTRRRLTGRRLLTLTLA
jgi:hypothetical protein